MVYWRKFSALLCSIRIQPWCNESLVSVFLNRKIIDSKNGRVEFRIDRQLNLIRPLILIARICDLLWAQLSFIYLYAPILRLMMLVA